MASLTLAMSAPPKKKKLDHNLTCDNKCSLLSGLIYCVHEHPLELKLVLFDVAVLLASKRYPILLSKLYGCCMKKSVHVIKHVML